MKKCRFHGGRFTGSVCLLVMFVSLGALRSANAQSPIQRASHSPTSPRHSSERHVVQRQADGQPVVVRSTGGVPAYATPMPVHDRVRIVQAQYTQPADIRPQLEPGARSGLQPIPQSQVIRSSPPGDLCECSPAQVQIRPNATPNYVPVVPRTAEVFRPLIPVSSVPSNYLVGRGVLGQPTIYVPGQPIRNVLRYFGP